MFFNSSNVTLSTCVEKTILLAKSTLCALKKHQNPLKYVYLYMVENHLQYQSNIFFWFFSQINTHESNLTYIY